MRFGSALVLAGVATVGGCGGGSSGPTGNTPGFSLVVGTPNLSLPTSGSTSTWVKAIRFNGFSGAITFSVTGAPTGITGNVVTTVSADSVRIDIIVTTIAPGTYTLTVHATAPGTTAQNVTITVVVGSATGVVFSSIAVGDHHACALTAAGAAYCWGKNDALQNATGNTGSGGQDLVPKPVQGGKVFASLTLPAAGSRACGVSTTGGGLCWGDNGNSEIGDNTTSIRGTPTSPSGGITFQSLAAGTHHTCGLTSGGSAYCWGLNQYGELGDNSTTLHRVPTSTATGNTWKEIVTGDQHTCALTTIGEAYCWGLGLHGEAGNGSNATNVLIPVKVSGSLTFRTLSAGFERTCGLTTTNLAYCWGYGASGVLGDGSSVDRNVPVLVSGGLTFQSLSVGFAHNCALTAAGVAYCWGYNASGGLGDGSFTDHPTPHLVSGGLTFKVISAGNGSTCALTTANVAYCWGSNLAGELGDNTLTFKLVPTAVHVP